MTKKMHMALFCAVAIIGLLISPVTAVDPAAGEPLYHPFDYAQDHPDIDGDMIVWEDDRNGQKDIYFGTIDAFRASSGYTGERITTDPNSQERPSISGDYIAWQDDRNGNPDIYLYERSTETTTQLTNDTGKQWLPAVSGNHVAWYDDSSGRTNIVLYDIAAGEVKDVIDSDAKTTIPGGATEFKPALSENYVAWVEEADQNVYYYDIAAETIAGPVSTSTSIQSWPSLSGSAIAWEDYRHGDFGGEIYMTDLDNPSGGEKRITNAPGDQVSPALSGSIIAWEDMRDGNRSIYMYDLATDEEMSVYLSPEPNDEQLYPAVSGNSIVWQRRATPNSNLYIFVYEPGAPIEPVVTTIEIDPEITTVTVNSTVKFTPTVRDQFNATMTGVEINWTSSNKTIGTIDNSTGLFTGVAVGLTTVTATAGNASASALVTVEAPVEPPVEPPEVASITVKPPTTTLQIGGTQQFEATVRDQFDRAMTGVNVTWASSNKTIGTIDNSTGLFTALAEGTTTVTATVGEITGEATVTVSAEAPPDPVAARITLTSDRTTAVVNETVTFSATVYDLNDIELPDVTVNWTSSDPAVGTINETGLFTAIGEGTANVTATAGNASASALVTVEALPEPILDNLYITPSGATLAIGDTQRFVVTASDQDGNAMTNVSVNWTSSDEDVGTIDEAGLFVALAEGTATVAATAENVTATATVTVINNEPALASIAVTPSEITLVSNDTAAFTATALDQFGNEFSGIEIAWTSSDPAVGTIDADGLFNAVADGTTTITATAENITGEATVTVATASSGVVVSPSTITLGAGESRQFTVHGLQDNAGSAVDWSCDDEAVGTIDTNGLFNAVADGIATITATAENETGTATVTVASSPVATRIEIEPATATIQPGETRAFTATVFDQRDSEMDWIRVTWSSSNPDVGTIDRAGLFGAFAEGSTEITASAGEAAGTAAITVSTTVVPEPTPVNPGGGGGSVAYSDGGGGSSEPTFCARTCENLASGQTFTFSDLTTSSVSSVNITAAGNIPQMMLTVKKTNAPSAAESPADDVYEYVAITSSWVNPSLIGNATVFFSVPTDWLGARNMTPEDVRLMRYANGAWESLETEVVGEESGLYRFRAITPGFSTFAIAASPSSLAASAEEIDVTPEVTETPEETGEVTTEPTEAVPATTTPAAPLVYAPFLAPLAFLLWGRRKN
ncbi:PGF-pre-PGF domain-containing protein [Methanoculleus sp. Afa-1]|uniref:PGF-pre-PGF domain-containing protein n=1 Tax=Methanoculleus formosensis TaxID=2590886 RepID=A0A9E5DCS5_9EURY|nr:Ig-like domain-containing protein [Methanoculleus sp. Afa-1]MCT8337482.1 PGF-pre-PGF domain-containing protein [Methanoculleus sp. Afa-1]